MNKKLKAGDKIKAIEETMAFFWSQGREGIVRTVHEGDKRGLASWGDDPTTLGFNCIDVVKINEVIT